ncbi:MAG: element excision factor XisI family protein [Rhizonema sp. NSF051]|nr:element excision factor XisI family protein [Rhizonema sp. NSF051]
MHNEWRNEYRIYGCAMQLNIIEDQIWIQHNSTEIFIDRELIKRGVNHKDIILGFRSPSVRKLLAAKN